MGLEPWARDEKGWTSDSDLLDNGRELRNELRANWRFEVETDGNGEQPFVSFVSGTEVEGQDVAVLRARERADFVSYAIGNPHYLESGDFPVDTPGLFFGEARFERFEAELADGFTDTEPLWLAHSPNPSDSSSNTTSLTSNPGYRLEETPSETWCATDAKICAVTPNNSVQPIRFSGRGCVRSTNDARQGSSGGAYLNIDREFIDGGFTGNVNPMSLSAIGVHHAGGDANWKETCESDEDCRDGGHCEDGLCQYVLTPEQPTEAIYTSFTASDAEIMRWAARDKPHGGTPFEPERKITGAEPSCRQEDTNGECVGYTSESGSDSGWGEVVNVSSRNTAENTREQGPEWSGWASCGFTDCSDSNNENCIRPREVAVGVLGAATTRRDSKSTRVGSLYLICAPYSSSAWAENWRFVEVTSRKAAGKIVDGQQIFEDTMRNEVGYSPLRRWLPQAFEERDVKDEKGDYHSQIRPISYKMCPPNYVLNGLTLGITKKTEELVSVSRVICVPVNESPVHGTDAQSYGPNKYFRLWADTDPKFDDYYLAKSDLMETFSIEQRLGIPRVSTADSFMPMESAVARCDDGDAAVALRWSRDEKGTIVGMNFECADAPRPAP